MQKIKNHQLHVSLTCLMTASLIVLAGEYVAGQEIKMGFIPPANSKVTEADYRKGKYILQNTYQSIEDHDGNIVYADLWNVGMAYSLMGVDHESIMTMFRESKRMNSDSFKQVIAHAFNGKDPNENRLIKLLGEPFKDLVRDCNVEIEPTTLAERIAKKQSQDLTGLNEELIDQLIVLMDKDQRHRYSHTSYVANHDAQNQLDKEIQTSLANLFDEHGYPGRALVGEEYAGCACLLLEHGGDLAHQEKYFPLVVEAFKNGEVTRPYLLMLVDRIHWKKTKKQIFGSHAGVPLDREEVIQKTRQDLGW